MASANPGDLSTAETFFLGRLWPLYLTVAVITAAVYVGCMVSPPSLMDDVDAVQAQIARNMLTSGDWVTPRIDGVLYLEKSPLIYWTIAASYKLFGATDWAARIPVVVSSIGLAMLTAAFGVWAFGKRAGFYTGICIGTCLGLFLFTRIQIPDVMLTFSIALAMWAFLRALDPEEPRPRLWAAILAACLGTGLLLKSLVAIVFPIAAAVIYLFATRQFFLRKTWHRLRPFSGMAIAVLIAAPWHVLATLRNPPYFAWTLHSGPSQYHGFLWFYFINEQILRFLNLRYPRDYNTVPRLYFWLFHFLWLFPWSVYFPSVVKLSFKRTDRAGQTRFLALCWTGFLLVFFTFSTTQEYYSMPCYPALALLLGSAMASEDTRIRRSSRVLGVVAALACVACFAIGWEVRNLPTPGDISNALALHPASYTLSLGHMLDLTFGSFAYLRVPLVMAGIAFLIGALGNLWGRSLRNFLMTALMMILFFQAARVALVVFDPFMSSRPIAETIKNSPPGQLVVNRHYYTYSSVFFYLNRDAPLINGKRLNLEYGGSAPDAPDVFITDARFRDWWLTPQRYYLVADGKALPAFAKLLGQETMNLVLRSGGKVLLTNQPFPGTSPGVPSAAGLP